MKEGTKRQVKTCPTVLAVIILTLTAHAADQTCATCHPQESKSQPHTAMGIAMEMPGHQVVLTEHPKLTFEAYGYRYAIENKNGVNTYTVSDGTDSLSLPINYAFGVHAETFVLQYSGRFYESLVSYYPSANGLAITMGSERLRPHNLVEAMGREAPHEEIVSCFGCHSSGGVSDGNLKLEAMKPGLDCEHCHAGATAHMQAISQGKTAALPKKLGAMDAEDTSEFCGACHRTWNAVLRMKTWGEINVRFQPYRLANSKCFLGNDRRIACTACHNPHADLVRDEASYDHNCVACHAKSSNVTQKICPVAAKNCVSCHMPKVELPGSHSMFTDHQIRVVRAGDPYPN